MKTTILNNATNDLRHTIITNDTEGNYLKINIRLNDECENGHQDFSITATAYEKGKPKTDRYFIYGGCAHDEILKVKPDLKIFVNLHLCDYEGIPMYAVENGFYNLTNGFNNTKPEDKNFKAEFCEYYRINEVQYNILATSKNKLQYALYLQSLGILSQWKQEANNAISLLEEMTGKKFVVDSKESQFNAPTQDEINKENERQLADYYTPAAEYERELAKRDELIKKLESERDKEITKATNEFLVKKQVLILGGETALNNCIYYSHSQQLAFNWKDYDNISSDLINTIKSVILLPEGVTIK